MDEAAARYGITAPYISRIEHNAVVPSEAALERMARALGVATDTLKAKFGYVPAQIVAAYAETPEALLAFALLPAERRRRFGRRRKPIQEET